MPMLAPWLAIPVILAQPVLPSAGGFPTAETLVEARVQAATEGRYVLVLFADESVPASLELERDLGSDRSLTGLSDRLGGGAEEPH